MTHLVFGAGLVGSYLAGVLAINGYRTTAIGRDTQLSALAAGVKLSDFLGNHATAPAVTAFNQHNDDAPEVIWLTVKCTDLTRAAQALKSVAGPKTSIVCCQNGLRAAHQIRAALPGRKVFSAVVPFNVVRLDDGTLHRGSEGPLTVPREIKRVLPGFSGAMQHPLLSLRFTSDISAVQAAKLQLNLSNAVNALSDLPVKTMLEDRGYRKIIAELMREWLEVASVNRIAVAKVTRIDGKWLPFLLCLPNFLFRRVARKMLDIDPTVRTSMWWDLQRGKATEIEDLNGEVVRQGVIARNYCPANKVIIDLIHDAEKQRRETGRYAAMSASELHNEIEIKRLEKSSYKI